ncbi:hypothetical protein HMPREF1548_02733 [Clostridium sp. KLE 1755]|nr:hypothetical protein HMPREF1548_02733 [Clostridium sp. KLE 1755]
MKKMLFLRLTVFWGRAWKYPSGPREGCGSGGLGFEQGPG